jgi:pyruvate/2-oxoglutarate dehydrogenase complex dihydrolipoamide acyltransferase (E2) component
MKKTAPHTRRPYPRMRLPMVDGGRMGRQKHTVHGLLEVDVTAARQALHTYQAQTGAALSFTAFILACLGQALDTHRDMHAYRDWRNQLIIFDQVDVNTLVEVEIEGRRSIRPRIIRAVNTKSVEMIHHELRTFQGAAEQSSEAQFLRWFIRLPGFARRLFYAVLFKNPHLLKQYFGTVALSSIGMFGSGGFWGLPVPNHTLQLTLGGIATKPGVVAGQIVIREYLSVTVSFDHDIVDGAPATRFVEHWKALVEGASGLEAWRAAEG